MQAAACATALQNTLSDSSNLARFPSLVEITSNSMDSCTIDVKMEPQELNPVDVSCEVCEDGSEYIGNDLCSSKYI